MEFEGVIIEDLLYCSEGNAAGISTQLLYAPADFFEDIKLPAETGDFEQVLIVNDDDIKFKQNYKWSTIDILIDENELKTAIEGALRRKKSKAEINFFITGLRTKVLGFVEKTMNVPMIFGVLDPSGKVWLFGNLRNRAFIDSADGTSGKKYEDNAGLSIKVGVKSAIYCIMKKPYKVYTATITQSGTNAPAAIELENDLGVVTFIYQNPGQYLMRSNSFDEKTVVMNQGFSKASNAGVVDGPSAVPGGNITDVAVSIIKSGNDFKINSKSLNSFESADGLIQEPLFVEIRKYQN